MKQETNNEMDLLLRRLGRRQHAEVSGDHLDADELSSYAENVLPATARARYTEHLAECVRCRELVVQLSSAAGVVAAAETLRAPEPAGWRKFLAGLFSPMVLRYAAPALGLLVVAVIGLVVLRRQQAPANDIAQLNEQTRPEAVTQPQATSSSESSQGYVGRVESSPSAAPRNKAQETAEAPPVPNNAPAVSVSADVQAEASKKLEEQQQLAKEAPPPPKTVAPAPTPAEEKQAKADDVAQKRETEGRSGTGYQSADHNALVRSRSEDRKSDEVAAARAPAKSKLGVSKGAETGAAAGARPEPREDSDTAKVAKDQDAAEVRTVAGRRFRKERGIWIDTAYDSSRGTTNLTRGSEQYRALIADEPGIKTIADQLDGEIIVVWKGRAYRIR